MTISEPRLRTLLRQAEKVAASGKRAAAESLYRQIIEEAPESEAAWLGLVKVVNGQAEKTAVYNHVLQINPESEGAKAGLDELQHGPANNDTVDDPIESDHEILETKIVPGVELEELITEPEPVIAEETAETTHDPEPISEQIETSVADFDLVCYRHPDRETSLRCYTCNKPICIKCANKTPVGYSCPDCIHDLQKGYYTATTIDYLVAFIVALPLSILAAYLVGFLGFFVFFVAPVIGTLIGRIVFWAVRRRRGRRLAHLVAATVVLGAVIVRAVPFILSLVIALFMSPEQMEATGGILGFLMSGGASLLWTGLYAFLAAGAAFYFVKV